LILLKEQRLISANIIAVAMEKIEMPFDAVMLSVAVSAVFIAFAAVLAWGDSQTRQQKADVPAPRRRSF
jgi:hypothetical protein